MNLHYSKLVNKESRSAEMLLYGEIGKEINGHQFAAELNWLAREYDNITVRINSVGGSIDQGLSVVSQMMSASAYIVAKVDGVAASMAAVILAAADKVIINDYAKVMIHSPYYIDETGAAAKNLTSKDRKALAMLKDTLETLLKKRGITDEAIGNMMKNDTWFTADEARAALLVDEVATTGRRELVSVEPYQLVAFLQSEVLHNNRNKNMKNIIAKLGLPEDSNEQAVEQAVASLQAKNTSLQKMVDKLVEVGKITGAITEKNEDAMKRLATADLDLFVDMLNLDALNSDVAEEGKQVRLSDVINKLNQLSNPGKQEEKDWDWYQRNDPDGLRKLKATDLATYTKLYKNYWGEEPK